MQDYKNLKVWQKAHHLVLAIYKSTAKFPKDELYGLTSQIRRAAVSIPANVAEGCARSGDPEFAHFLTIAQASASELDYHLLLSRDLKYLDAADYDRIAADLTEIRRMLTTFIQKLKANS
jgi:four helix bundle protein